MGKPAGVQIYRWFAFLVGLLIAVNLVGLAGSFVISRSVRAVVEEAEPLATSTASIQSEILAAQRDLFQYLAEFSDDPSAAVNRLNALTAKVREVRKLSVPDEVSAELESIERSAEQYRKVLELLPRTVQGSRDWTRLQEYSAKAVELGKGVEERSRRLAEAAQQEIRRRSKKAASVARAATWIAVAALIASGLSVASLRHWWKRFQEVILGL